LESPTQNWVVHSSIDPPYRGSKEKMHRRSKGFELAIVGEGGEAVDPECREDQPKAGEYPKDGVLIPEKERIVQKTIPIKNSGNWRRTGPLLKEGPTDDARKATLEWDREATLKSASWERSSTEENWEATVRKKKSDCTSFQKEKKQKPPLYLERLLKSKKKRGGRKP